MRLLSICGSFLALFALTGIASAAESTNAAMAALPTFKLHGVVLKAEDLKYRPHNDVIHPSVLPIGRHLTNALGKFYMYYAPHDAPGGICVAFADKPEGPWGEYTNNPVISRDWAPHYKVSHVSAPEAIWNEEERKVFLYFHGENNVQRLASSEDGIYFKYERAVLTSNMVEEGVREVAYGRVFRHTLPGKDNRYIQFFLGNRRGTRLVYLAWSKNGREWQTRKTPVLNLAPGTTQIANAIYFPWKGRHYLIFHGHSNATNLNIDVDFYAAETDPAFERITHLGKFMDRRFVSPDNPALMAPFILEEGGKYYLYFNIGKRLNNQIALAIATP
ncbi:MAG TPA: hypothetical protein VK633_09330 [Verrucomicrobiae bacterium]|nr:hypothetical protein [Verrucomicrobiae bacterium]